MMHASLFNGWMQNVSAGAVTIFSITIIHVLAQNVKIYLNIYWNCSPDSRWIMTYCVILLVSICEISIDDGKKAVASHFLVFSS